MPCRRARTDEETVGALRAALGEADVEIEEDSETAAQPGLDLTPGVGGTTDSLQLFLNALGRYPLLSAAEEVALAKRIVRGDRAAYERAVNSNLRLVVSLAMKDQGHGVALGDQIKDGIIDLNRVEKFDDRKGFKFSTYATRWIRQACQRAVANQSATSLEEIGRELGLTRERIQQIDATALQRPEHLLKHAALIATTSRAQRANPAARLS